jgi:hypothetical protein
MGWFGSGKAEKPNASPREDRSKCWEARDAYFACLDAAEVVVAGTEGSKCAEQRKFYEQNCAKSWVSLSLLPHASVFVSQSEPGVKKDRLFQPTTRAS